MKDTQNDWTITENPHKWMSWGYPYLRKPPIISIYIYIYPLYSLLLLGKLRGIHPSVSLSGHDAGHFPGRSGATALALPNHRGSAAQDGSGNGSAGVWGSGHETKGPLRGEKKLGNESDCPGGILMLARFSENS